MLLHSDRNPRTNFDLQYSSGSRERTIAIAIHLPQKKKKKKPQLSKNKTSTENNPQEGYFFFVYCFPLSCHNLTRSFAIAQTNRDNDRPSIYSFTRCCFGPSRKTSFGKSLAPWITRRYVPTVPWCKRSPWLRLLHLGFQFWFSLFHYALYCTGLRSSRGAPLVTHLYLEIPALNLL